MAIISDIHGNRIALNAALADIKRQSTDRIVCLGDTVQGGPQPVETLEKLREIGFPVVMGNADDWLLKGESETVEPTSDEQREVRRWTLSKLTPGDVEFLRSYRPTVEVELGGTDLLLCFHGSPKSYDDILLPDTPQEKWDELLGMYASSIMAGGHTHTQQIRRVRSGLFLNPGSIGVVYDYHLPKERFHTEPWAEYAILSFEGRQSAVEFRRAYYDLDDFIESVRASGRPYAEHTIKDYGWSG